MTGEHTRRVRMSRATKDAQFGHSPPVVIWWCHHKPRRKMLEVFLTRNGWHVIGSRLRVSVDDYFRRIGSDLTSADVHEGRAMGSRRVAGVAADLPFEIESWPLAETFEVGCSCRSGPAVRAALTWLAEDCRHARDDRKRIERIIG